MIEVTIKLYILSFFKYIIIIDILSYSGVQFGNESVVLEVIKFYLFSLLKDGKFRFDGFYVNIVGSFY